MGVYIDLIFLVVKPLRPDSDPKLDIVAHVDLISAILHISQDL